MSRNFAITGVAGFVAPRHLRAIRDTGNRLVAAVDPHDCVGVLDQFAPEARYFPEIERFDRHLEKLRRGPAQHRVDYVSICSPNYLHDAHVRLALRVGADAICEKPLVINPWNLDALQALEEETGKQVYTVLQLRLHPSLLELKKKIDAGGNGSRHQVNLTYVTGRGNWYLISWKGSAERSGGLAANIGIHFFDALLWLFGPPERSRVFLREERRMSGYLELEKAEVTWFLSVDPADLPEQVAPGGPMTHRSMLVAGREVEFSGGFTDLHTQLYAETLAGRGFGIGEARQSIELAYRIREDGLVAPDDRMHSLARRYVG